MNFLAEAFPYTGGGVNREPGLQVDKINLGTRRSQWRFEVANECRDAVDVPEPYCSVDCGTVDYCGAETGPHMRVQLCSARSAQLLQAKTQFIAPGIELLSHQISIPGKLGTGGLGHCCELALADQSWRWRLEDDGIYHSIPG
eukprot:scaffold258250_cov17-Tisochrysis_lutea.AAC.1